MNWTNLSFCSFCTDEKERFDPSQFQESIVQGLNQTGTDLEAVAKFLDASGAKLDYRRYAETLFDILVAGGMLGELQAFLLNFALYNGNKMCPPVERSLGLQVNTGVHKCPPLFLNWCRYSDQQRWNMWRT